MLVVSAPDRCVNCRIWWQRWVVNIERNVCCQCIEKSESNPQWQGGCQSGKRITQLHPEPEFHYGCRKGLHELQRKSGIIGVDNKGCILEHEPVIKAYLPLPHNRVERMVQKQLWVVNSSWVWQMGHNAESHF